MIRGLVVAAIVFVLGSVATFFVLGASLAADAEVALRLRASGETVVTTVVSRIDRTVTTGAGSQRRTSHVTELEVHGTMASGQSFDATLPVSPEILSAQPEGSTLDMRVSPTDASEYMLASDVLGRDASGHHEGDGSFRIVGSLLVGGGLGLIFGLIAGRRRRA